MRGAPRGHREPERSREASKGTSAGVGAWPLLGPEAQAVGRGGVPGADLGLWCRSHL